MKRPRLALAAALAAGLLAGCGQATPDEGETMQQRPDLAAAEQEYHDLLAAMLDRLAELAPDVAWGEGTPATMGETICEDDGVQDGRSRNYSTGGGGAIPDEDWARVPEVVAEVLEPAGFEEYAVIVDRPGQHSVSFYGPYGAELKISGQRSTTILLLGGCFPTEPSDAG